jgi:hypothetical protein
VCQIISLKLTINKLLLEFFMNDNTIFRIASLGELKLETLTLELGTLFGEPFNSGTLELRSPGYGTLPGFKLIFSYP